MPDTPADPVAAYLDDAQKRYQAFGETGAFPALLAAVEAALEVAGKHEHGATRWENPLPVPAWIPELREAISRELLGEGGDR